LLRLLSLLLLPVVERSTRCGRQAGRGDVGTAVLFSSFALGSREFLLQNCGPGSPWASSPAPLAQHVYMAPKKKEHVHKDLVSDKKKSK
jgi:hypothetical protein